MWTERERSEVSLKSAGRVAAPFQTSPFRLAGVHGLALSVSVSVYMYICIYTAPFQTTPFRLAGVHGLSLSVYTYICFTL
jgi:hypothetical protein